MVKFTSTAKYLDFVISKSSGLLQTYKNSITNATIAKIYTTSWPIVRNNNVYDKLTEQDKKKLEDAVISASKILNSVNP